VRDVLRELGVAATRMTFDGRGDTESVAEAGSHPSADDGRVEIVLLVGR
jgi:outer membrane protein OmpA-like peptidoglycan-associated protein